MKLPKRCHCWMICKMWIVLTVISCNCFLNAQGKFTRNPTRTLKSNFQATITNASFHSKTKDEPKLSTSGPLQIHNIQVNVDQKPSPHKRSNRGIEGHYKEEKIANPRLVEFAMKRVDWNDSTQNGFLSRRINLRVRKSVQKSLRKKRTLERQMSTGSPDVSSLEQENFSIHKEKRKHNTANNSMLISQQPLPWMMFNEQQHLVKYETIPKNNFVPIANKNRRNKHNKIWKYKNREKRLKKLMKRETLLYKNLNARETGSHSQRNIAESFSSEPSVNNEAREFKTNEASMIPLNTTGITPRDHFLHNNFAMKTIINSSENEPNYSTLTSINSSYISNEQSTSPSTWVTKPQSLNAQTPTSPTTSPTFTEAFPLEEYGGSMSQMTKESEKEQNITFSATMDTSTNQEKCKNQTETNTGVSKLVKTTQKVGSAIDVGSSIASSMNKEDCQALAQTSSPPPLPPTEPIEEKAILFRQKYPVQLWTTLGLFDDTYLEVINLHWLSFEPPKPIIHKVFAIMYGIGMVVGCGGNLLVIFMFIRCRTLRTPPNYLIANLAISDFLMMAKTPIYIINSLYQGPVMGALGCKIYGFMGGLTGTASIMTLAAISLDRFYVIVHPLNPFKRTTITRAILMISVVWLYAGIFSSLPLFGINKYTSEGYLTSCSFDYLSDEIGSRAFVFVFFLAAWLLPLTVICFSYVNIFRMVRSAEKLDIFTNTGGRSSGESFKYRQDPKKQKSEVKIALLACFIISLWILAWTPYALVALLGIFGWKQYLTPMISAIPSLFCKTASCINPFVYSINHPRFQRELRSTFQICFRYHKRKNSRGASFYSAVTCRENETPDDNNRRQSLKKISSFRKNKVSIPTSSIEKVSTVSASFQVASSTSNNLKKSSFRATGYEKKPLNMNLTDLTQHVDVEAKPFPSKIENTSLNSTENKCSKPGKYARCQSIGNMSSNNFSARLARTKKIITEKSCIMPTTFESRTDKNTKESGAAFHRATSLPEIIDLQN